MALHFRRGIVPSAGESTSPMPLQAGRDVPEISRFYGIVVRMYYDDHPPPHFHAQYGRHEITVHLSDLTVKDGWLPKRVLALLTHWAGLHGDELMENWTLARLGRPLKRIEGLP